MKVHSHVALATISKYNLTIEIYVTTDAVLPCKWALSPNHATIPLKTKYYTCFRRFIFCSVGFHTCCYFAGEVDRFPVVGREARACAERCQLLPEVHG